MDTVLAENPAVDKKTIHQVLAHNVRKIRNARGLTQAQLGEKAKCGQSHISRIEATTMPTGPTVEALDAIARALNVQPWELLVDDGPAREEAIRRMLGPWRPAA